MDIYLVGSVCGSLGLVFGGLGVYFAKMRQIKKQIALDEQANLARDMSFQKQMAEEYAERAQSFEAATANKVKNLEQSLLVYMAQLQSEEDKRADAEKARIHAENERLEYYELRKNEDKVVAAARPKHNTLTHLA